MSCCVRCRSVLVAVLAGYLQLGCPDEPRGQPAPTVSASALAGPLAPEAELFPAPLARPDAAVEAGAADASHDGASVSDRAQLEPRPLREDRPVAGDSLPGHDAVGISLQAQWRWHAIPGAHSGAEVDRAALDRAREFASFSLRIDVSPLGRMRVAFSGPAFVLPQNAELRARDDHYGHLLVWPDRKRYRVLSTGTLRALVQEYRADVLPLAPAPLKRQKGGSLHGFDTTRIELATSFGKVVLEQAELPATGIGGALLCRLLLELVAAHPASTACTDGLLPLRADYHWPEGGTASFVVSDVLRGQQLLLENLLTPPAGAAFHAGGLPSPRPARVLSKGQLRALRTRDIQPAQPAAPADVDEGLVAVNHTDTLQYLLLDGIAAAWVKPLSELHVRGLRLGRYQVSWRDPLGTTIQPVRPIDVPGKVTVGQAPDAGTEND